MRIKEVELETIFPLVVEMVQDANSRVCLLVTLADPNLPT